LVIKGYSCKNGQKVAAHLLRTDTNERVNVLEVRGTVSENLFSAFREVEAVAAGTRCTKPLYHASINTRADEVMTGDQRDHAINTLEEALGFGGQPRAVVQHVKNGREHYHIVWSRIDVENMRALRADFNYRTHEEVSRQLEREFGHERVQGAHVERDGVERPERTPNRKEMAQIERGGMSPQDARTHISGLWQAADNGKSFVAALEESGWVLARGDRRDFVVIDPNGGVHSLPRRIEGARVKDVREKLADFDPAELPDVRAGKQMQSDRQTGLIADERLQNGAPEETAPERKSEEEELRQKDRSQDEDSSVEVATHRGGMVAQQREANRMIARHRERTGEQGDELNPQRSTERRSEESKGEDTKREALVSRFVRKQAAERGDSQAHAQDRGPGSGGTPGGGTSR
jgi:hypothetical protein